MLHHGPKETVGGLSCTKMWYVVYCVLLYIVFKYNAIKVSFKVTMSQLTDYMFMWSAYFILFVYILSAIGDHSCKHKVIIEQR